MFQTSTDKIIVDIIKILKTIYLNVENYRPQDISPIKFFCFLNIKKELLAFLGWTYYTLERLPLLYALINFIGFLFSLLEGIYNTCAIYTQVNGQAGDFFEIFSTHLC